MPTLTVSRVITAPREEIWKAISDIANARRWNPHWNEIEITSKQTHGSGTSFRARTEDRDFDFVVGDWVAPEYITFVPVRDPSERYSITLESHSFRLKEVGAGETLVELIARADAHGVRGRFIALFFWAGYQKQGLNTALESLEDLFGGSRDDRDQDESEAVEG